MAEKQRRTAARATNGKAGTRKKSPSQRASKSAGDSKDTAPGATATKAAGRTKRAPRRSSTKVAPQGPISPEERYRMIPEAAAVRAETDGFACDPWKCWLVAEAEIDAGLAGSR